MNESGHDISSPLHVTHTHTHTHTHTCTHVTQYLRLRRHVMWHVQVIRNTYVTWLTNKGRTRHIYDDWTEWLWRVYISVQFSPVTTGGNWTEWLWFICDDWTESLWRVYIWRVYIFRGELNRVTVTRIRGENSSQWTSLKEPNENLKRAPHTFELNRVTVTRRRGELVTINRVTSQFQFAPYLWLIAYDLDVTHYLWDAWHHFTHVTHMNESRHSFSSPLICDLLYMT